ncbi:MAG: hypothetical protein M1837_005274 [Sclerophora amabilis]|nr:MAG: hypothetical protein M1837_005274 [Sclerophora amabilis]
MHGKILKALHYATSPVAFLYFVCALTVSACLLQTAAAEKRRQVWPRTYVLWGTAGVFLTYYDWWAPEDSVVFFISSMLFWSIQILSLIDTACPVWYPYYGSWVITLASESVLMVFYGIFHHPASPLDLVGLSIQVIRACVIVTLLVLVLLSEQARLSQTDTDEERQSLLSREPLVQASGSNIQGSTQQACGSTEYGTLGDGGTTNRPTLDEEDETESVHDEDAQKVFIPYAFPTRSRRLQLNLCLVGLSLLAERALNVLIPRQLGLITDALGGSDGIPAEITFRAKPGTKSATGKSVWFEIGLFCIFRLLGSAAGFQGLRSVLWIPINQYSYQTMTTAIHAHIMRLSCDFHDNKKSGEIYKSIEQGRAVTDLIESVLFQIIPMMADLVVAFSYLYFLFGVYMALLAAVVTILYLSATTRLVSKQRSTRRRNMVSLRKEFDALFESIGGWWTVTYFNRLVYEEEKYSRAVGFHMKNQRDSELAYTLLNAIQSVIFKLGLFCACFFAAYKVMEGPVSFFAHSFRRLANDMLDAERLLELFQTKPSIQDRAGAKALSSHQGKVAFHQVGFSYDPRKITLDNITFSATPGQTVALIGETGGGKSTILKLLFRFYDVSWGSIKIDEQDVRDVTLSSLREEMGIDPSLFNDSILSNVRYARLDASDQEIFDACKAAAIHDRIVSFPDGYKTKVGERGIKLSGGERQRLAIARAHLKDPKIIILDEATSMVDTETESRIQEAFARLAKGRTTFVIASHRLSTIVSADLILVVEGGRIIERGNHGELLQKKGKYHDLWSKQSFLAPVQPQLAEPEGLSHPNSQFLDAEVKHCFGSAYQLPHTGSTDNELSYNNELPVNTNQPAIIGNGEGKDLISNSECDYAWRMLGGLEKDEESKTIQNTGLWRPDVPPFVPRLFRAFGSDTAPSTPARSEHEKNMATTNGGNSKGCAIEEPQQEPNGGVTDVMKPDQRTRGTRKDDLPDISNSDNRRASRRSKLANNTSEMTEGIESTKSDHPLGADEAKVRRTKTRSRRYRKRKDCAKGCNSINEGPREEGAAAVEEETHKDRSHDEKDSAESFQTVPEVPQDRSAKIGRPHVKGIRFDRHGQTSKDTTGQAESQDLEASRASENVSLTQRDVSIHDLRGATGDPRPVPNEPPSDVGEPKSSLLGSQLGSQRRRRRYWRIKKGGALNAREERPAALITSPGNVAAAATRRPVHDQEATVHH